MDVLEQIRQSRTKERISTAELTLTTRSNLEALERHGYSFSTTAFKMPITQRDRVGSTFPHHWPARSPESRPLAPETHLAHSFVIEGTSPNGEDTVYVRWETAGPAAGQTWLYINNKRHRLLHILQQLGERETY